MRILIAQSEGSETNGIVHQQEQALFRLDSQGHLDKIYTVAPDQYLPYRVAPNNPFVSLVLPSTTRDSSGRIWIWDSMPWSSLRGTGLTAVEGFLVTDGKSVKYYRDIQGLPTERLMSLDAWDKNHLVAAFYGEGLYAINITTLKARRISNPQPSAFRFVKRSFTVGDVHYVLTVGPGFATPRGIVAPTPGTLWRLRGGDWKEILDDAGSVTGAALAGQDGLWVGTADNGLWYIPKQGPARRIGLQNGLSLSAVSQLFGLPDGDILATDAGRYSPTRTLEFNPATMLATPKASTLFSVVHPKTALESDRDHNLWGLLKFGYLGEWNGTRWIEHAFPPTVQANRIDAVNVDTYGRVWLIPNCSMGPMGFFDPALNRWSFFRDYRLALSELRQPVKFLHLFPFPTSTEMIPIYGSHSQIALVGPCWGVNYFDGERWRLWNRTQLPGTPDLARPPFFDSAGHLAFDPNPNVSWRGRPEYGSGRFQETTWEWTPAAGWHSIPYEPGKPFKLSNPLNAQGSPPMGCKTMTPSALVRDSSGRDWWVANGELYEGITGHCKPALAGSIAQPFIDGRRLVRALLDNRGNAFLETQGPFSYIFIPRKDFAGRTHPVVAARSGAR